MPPLRLSRYRQIDVCAQCHGGEGKPIAPAFSFRPAEALSEYVKLQEPNATDRLDVHGNQVSPRTQPLFSILTWDVLLHLP